MGPSAGLRDEAIDSGKEARWQACPDLHAICSPLTGLRRTRSPLQREASQSHRDLNASKVRRSGTAQLSLPYMSTGVVHVAPAVIRWARQSAGIHIEEAARSAHVEPEVLAKWEERDAAPTARQLERLADAYKRPVSVLLRAEPPPDAPLPVDFRRLPRSKRTLSSVARLAIRRARRAQRIYRQLDSGRISLLPALPSDLKRDPERAAAFARERLDVAVEAQLVWRSTDAAVRHWRTALEGTGALVFRFSVPVDEVRGFSINGSPPVVAISNQDPPQAQSFTLFHEWCHLLLGGSGLCRPSELNRGSREEDEVFCNAFAGALLVPMKALLAHPATALLRASNGDPAEVATVIAKAFSASRFVALRRLLTAELIRETTYRQLVAAWLAQPTTKRRARFGPSPAVRTVSELGRTFVEAVLRARDRAAISETDAADYLSTSTRHLERIGELVTA